jgi:hypothetical protein
LIAVVSLTASLAWAGTRVVTEMLRPGKRSEVYLLKCNATFCKDNVCFTLKDREGRDGRASISIKGPWPWSDSDKPVEATGRHCTPSKYMVTPVMTYTIYVEPLDGDLFVSYSEECEQGEPNCQ